MAAILRYTANWPLWLHLISLTPNLEPLSSSHHQPTRPTTTHSCQARQSCQLRASNEIFGDACPGTHKYLEVHYQCVLANRTAPLGAGEPLQPSAARATGK